jgi:hypothetical protein
MMTALTRAAIEHPGTATVAGNADLDARLRIDDPRGAEGDRDADGVSAEAAADVAARASVPAAAARQGPACA